MGGAWGARGGRMGGARRAQSDASRLAQRPRCRVLCTQVDDESINALIAFQFAPGSWTQMVVMREIPLPTQDCCCHRVCVVEEGLRPEQHSLVISELSSSKLFQVKLQNLKAHTYLAEVRTTLGEFEERKYVLKASFDGKRYSLGLSESDEETYLSRVLEHDERGRPLAIVVRGAGIYHVHYEGEVCVVEPDDFTSWHDVKDEIRAGMASGHYRALCRGTSRPLAR